jgi:hypothetical protein
MGDHADDLTSDVFDSLGDDLWDSEVHDLESLEQVLNTSSLSIRANRPRQKLKLKTSLVWIDKEGNVHLPSEMTTEHLQNVINYCKRLHMPSTPILKEIQRELDDRNRKSSTSWIRP